MNGWILWKVAKVVFEKMVQNMCIGKLQKESLHIAKNMDAHVVCVIYFVL